jgi:hypothetical protein
MDVVREKVEDIKTKIHSINYQDLCCLQNDVSNDENKRSQRTQRDHSIANSPQISFEEARNKGQPYEEDCLRRAKTS